MCAHVTAGFGSQRITFESQFFPSSVCSRINLRGLRLAQPALTAAHQVKGLFSLIADRWFLSAPVDPVFRLVLTQCIMAGLCRRAAITPPRAEAEQVEGLESLVLHKDLWRSTGSNH